jgi:hypothetical protein
MGKTLLAATAALLCLVSAAARAENCSLRLIASYNMANTNSVVAIPIVMAGKPRYVSLDTGSFASWVTQKFIDDDKLETHSITGMKVYGASARAAKYVVVPSVDIGPIHQPASNFMVEAANHMGELSAGLGNNALAQFDVEFDFAARKVNFFSQDHCEGKVVYWTKSYTEMPFSMLDDQIHIVMTLDGHDFDTVFDTGTSYTYVNKRVFVGVFGGDDASEREITLHDHKVKAATFKSLSVGGITFPNPSLLIMEDKMRELAKEDVPVKDQNQAGVTLMHFPHILLGLDALSHLHFYIAFREHKIYVTSADAH